MFDIPLPGFVTFLGVCALLCLIGGVWYFATGRRKELALTPEERERYAVTDPALGPARALMTSMRIDAQKAAPAKKANGDDGGSADGGGD